MTRDPRFDVVAVGNALVDVLSTEDPSFVHRHGLAHGAATMVDAAASDALYEAMSPGVEMSGGSAANTAAGIASLGGSAAFIGKVADDQLGKVFVHDLRAAGVTFDSPPDGGGLPTGRCLVVVTEGERTMCTHLGVAPMIAPADVDHSMVEAGSVTYLEGYLWDQPDAKDAIVAAMETAARAGRRVAFTLSDPFCVDRHRGEFLELVREHVDVVFANEFEAMSLFEVDAFDQALASLRDACEIVAVTRSAAGSVVAGPDGAHAVAAAPVADVVDVTGAGDLYAAGFLYGLTHGHPLELCGRIGAVAAAEVISHIGARPATSLADLAAPLLAG